jgi:hypothetical protein
VSSDAPQESPTTQAATSAAAALELRIAGRAGPTFVLDPAHDNTLGRSPEASIVVADRLASRTHAAVRFDASRSIWVLHDLGSRICISCRCSRARAVRPPIGANRQCSSEAHPGTVCGGAARVVEQRS